MYEVGDSFHTFIAAFEAVLQWYGMMNEAALRLPECFSPWVLSLYLSLPQKVQSIYTESVAVLRQFWPALPGVSNFDDLNDNYGLPLLKQGHDLIEKFATKVCAVATSIAKVTLNDLISWPSICCGGACQLMLTSGWTNVMTVT